MLLAVLAVLALGALVLAGRKPVEAPGPSPLAAGPGEALELLDSPVGPDGRFLDPVTREPVDPGTAAYQADLYGTTFYFASRASFERFRQEPLKYVRARVKVQIQLAPGVPGGAPSPEVGPPGSEVPSEPEPAEAEQWSEPTEPPPPVEAAPGGPAQEPGPGGPAQEPGPVPRGGPSGGPGWLPGPEGASPDLPDDVILTPASPVAPAPGSGDDDVILDSSPPPPRR